MQSCKLCCSKEGVSSLQVVGMVHQLAVLCVCKWSKSLLQRCRAVTSLLLAVSATQHKPGEILSPDGNDIFETSGEQQLRGNSNVTTSAVQ